MRDRVRKLVYVEPQDMDHFEGWLEDMARRGLHWEGQGPLFVRFRRGEPAPVRYRLEPRGSLRGRESQEYCRSMGWEYLGGIGRYFDLYRNEDARAPELHTDPVVRACGLERTARAMKRLCLVLSLLVLAFLAMVLVPLFLMSFPVETFLTGSALTFCALVMEFVAIASSIRAVAAFFAIRRRLREGVASRRDGSWRWVAGWNTALMSLAAVLLLLCVWSLTVSLEGGWEGALDGAAEPYPILALQEVEGDPTLEPVPDALSAEVLGYDWDNSVRYHCYPLLSEKYEVEQRLTDGGDYEPDLNMEWYRLSLPLLAAPLMDELVYRYTEHNYFPEEFTVEELDLPGFDRAVLATDNQWPGQRLFLQAGRVVIYLDYAGRGDLTAHPQLLEELAGWRK